MSTGISDRDPPFHAQSDIAALVFGRSENPDFVLSEFVSDLESSGKRVAGMLQLGRQAERTAITPYTLRCSSTKET
jgi:hypothetical protein